MLLSSMIISANAGVKPTVFHPIRDLYRSLTKCAGSLAVWEAAQKVPVKPNALKGPNDSYWWHTGTKDVVNSSNNGYYEAYRAHYDPQRHVVLVEQILYEGGGAVIARAARSYEYTKANLSSAVGVNGLWIGQRQSEVERRLGKGYRHDECGYEQHYYFPVGITVYILTYEAGRLTKVVMTAAESA
jgi:hypothetical protein